MDNGEVIPNLDKPWEFLMARVDEWITGAIVALSINELFFEDITSSMPLVFSCIVLVAYGLACARLRFADGKRGMINWVTTKMGFVPVGIPAPSELQPVWSGAPLRRLKDTTLFMQLGFDELFKEKLEKKLLKNKEEGRL